ncbi:MAG: mechanosensitive ion channel family protein [Myxococcota bacterium]
MDFVTPESLIESGIPAEYAPLVATGIEWGINILFALVIVAIGWWLSRRVEKWTLQALETRSVDKALTRFIAALAQWTVLVLTGIQAVAQLGMPATSFVAVLGSAGIAIGLALQGTLSHFASGVMLLLFRPFTIGDMVTVGGSTGVVDEIGLFATKLITPDNQVIIVPNSAITGDVIVNMTTRGTRRADVVVGVGYGTNLAEAERVLLAACKSVNTVIDEPAPAVALAELGGSSVDFKLMAWCASSDYLGTLAGLRTAAYDALNREGIEIPFPQITVHQAASAAEAAAK